MTGQELNPLWLTCIGKKQDISVWKIIAQDALIMNIDDLLCVGAIIFCFLPQSEEIKLDYRRSFVSHNKRNRRTDKRTIPLVTIHSTGGETADVGDIVRTIIVDSTVTARMKRSKVIDNANKAGDVIVGLASFGQSTYEKSYNGGMGSNGLTSARHDVLEIFGNQVPGEL
jgi:phosphoribosylformylglycinamidine cyclo-ligase